MQLKLFEALRRDGTKHTGRCISILVSADAAGRARCRQLLHGALTPLGLADDHWRCRSAAAAIQPVCVVVGMVEDSQRRDGWGGRGRGSSVHLSGFSKA